ncbi:hypothetical protein [Rickettsia oklahomensis]|uniref:Uncharacterized protein n=1 Tax=Rickettsia oklahomensis TaxID=3141789 RepID=A0AAU7BYG4_9RICK
MIQGKRYKGYYIKITDLDSKLLMDYAMPADEGISLLNEAEIAFIDACL